MRIIDFPVHWIYMFIVGYLQGHVVYFGKMMYIENESKAWLVSTENVNFWSFLSKEQIMSFASYPRSNLTISTNAPIGTNGRARIGYGRKNRNN